MSRRKKFERVAQQFQEVLGEGRAAYARGDFEDAERNLKVAKNAAKQWQHKDNGDKQEDVEVDFNVLLRRASVSFWENRIAESIDLVTEAEKILRSG